MRGATISQFFREHTVVFWVSVLIFGSSEKTTLAHGMLLSGDMGADLLHPAQLKDETVRHRKNPYPVPEFVPVQPIIISVWHLSDNMSIM